MLHGVCERLSKKHNINATKISEISRYTNLIGGFNMWAFPLLLEESLV